MAKPTLRFQAILMLFLATLCWSCSFVLIKSIALDYHARLPQRGSEFITCLIMVFRFGGAALIVLFFCLATLRRLIWLEIWQGVGLAAIGGLGLWIQMDGLNYTLASTSAFLTQLYCVFIPFSVAAGTRRWPSLRIVVSCGLVVVGSAVLAQLDWKNLKLGRGEIETILASVVFAAQIFWLERPLFAPNRPLHTTLVMFTGTAVLFAVCVLASSNGARDGFLAYASPPSFWLSVILTIVCTVIAYTLMNIWQPRISATEAGLIYGVEPVFASIFALFVPAGLSVLVAIDYPNEKLTASLLIGGGMISAANVVMHWNSALRIFPRKD